MSTAKRVKALPGDARFRWELCIYKVLGIVQNSAHGQSLHFCCVLIFCLAPVLGWGWRFTLSSKTKKKPFFFFFSLAVLCLSYLCVVLSRSRVTASAYSEVWMSQVMLGVVLRYAETFQAGCLDSASDCESADAFQKPDSPRVPGEGPDREKP